MVTALAAQAGLRILDARGQRPGRLGGARHRFQAARAVGGAQRGPPPRHCRRGRRRLRRRRCPLHAHAAAPRSRGWTKLAAASKRWLDEAAAIQAEALERIDGGAGDGAEVDGGCDAQLVILLFEALAERESQAPASEHKRPRGRPRTRTAAGR